MTGLEDLSRRLDSVVELQSIVGTMKALSAASIRQYEEAVDALRSYRHTVDLALQVVLRDAPAMPARTRFGAVGVIVFGSDLGLCGQFNEQIVAHTVERLATIRSDVPRHLLAVGARAEAVLADVGFTDRRAISMPAARERLPALAQRILQLVDAWRAHGINEVWLFHHRYDIAGRSEPVATRLLPVDRERLRAAADRQWRSRRVPTYSMPQPDLLSAALRQYFFVALIAACAESLASEHGNRLAAMRSAERELADRHEELQRRYRRERQEAITAELLDLSSGFNATA